MASDSRTVILIGSLDTKGREYRFVRDRIRAAGVETVVLDFGIVGEPPFAPDVPASSVAAAAGTSLEALRRLGQEPGGRGRAIDMMARGAATLVGEMERAGGIGAVMGLGGGQGSTVISAAMRALPIGVPKLLVSTMSPDNVGRYFGATDLCLMYAVTDIAGLNRVSRRILANAADAVIGMARAPVADGLEDRPLVGITMFGTTTAGVMRVQERLESAGFETIVFHAVGSGGRAMEDMVASGLIDAVVDYTPSELVDELLGGIFSAGPTRLEAAGSRGVPQVVVPGALGQLTLGPLASVPERFRGDDRLMVVHNPSVTVVRANASECAAVGRALAEKLAKATGPTIVALPMGGLSDYEAPGGPLHDPVADAALFAAIRDGLPDHVPVIEVPGGINDHSFADRVAELFIGIARDMRPVMRDAGTNHAHAEGIKQEGSGMSDTQPLATRLREKAARGQALVGAGAGIGLSAKCAADAGVDLIVVYNSGRYRMAGRGSTSGYLPFGDGNQIVFDMAGEIIPMAAGIPVIAGVCGTDPFRIMPVYLQELRRVGYAGVQNFPTVGLIDGRFRQSLEETGLGYGLEVEMIAAAHELGMLTAPYVFTPDEGRAMAEAGADLVVAHMGVTVKGMVGAQTAMSLDEAAERVQEIQSAVAAVRPDAMVLCHGGPIAEPADAAYILDHTSGVVGFFGASSMERLPTEVAMTARIREFTELRSTAA